MAINYVTDKPLEKRGYPGDKTIRKTAVENMRTYDKTGVRRMVKEGTLDAHLDSIVAEVKNHGETLIGVGVMPSEAWRRAVRVHVLGHTDE